MKTTLLTLSIWLVLSVLFVPNGFGSERITLVGDYKSIQCREGKEKRSYVSLPVGRDLLMDVDGPVMVVILTRGIKNGPVDFILQLDDSMKASTGLDLLKNVSKGIFIEVPKGRHRYKIRALAKVVIRPKITKRTARAKKAAIAFSKPMAPPKQVQFSTPPTVVESITKADIEPSPEADKDESLLSDDKEPVKTTLPPVMTQLNTEIRDRPVEIRLRMLSDKMAEVFKSMPGQGRYERLLVARFDQRGKVAEDKEMGVIVTAQLNTYLKRDHGFNLIERERLGDVLREIEMSMTGLLDPSKVAELGKMAGAQAMIVGSVVEMGADFSINARVISVESAEVLVAESITIPIKGMIALSDKSVVLRTKSGAVFRSLMAPGWGQFYNQQPVKGGVLMGLEVALAGTAVALHLLGKKDHDVYSSSSFEDDYPGLTPSQLADKASGLKNSAENYYQARNILIYTAVGVWLYNILDSYLFGVDGSGSHLLEFNPISITDARQESSFGLGFGCVF